MVLSVRAMSTVAYLIRLRVYALTAASKYILIVFGSLVTASLATGLWLVSVESATGNARIRCFLSTSNHLPQLYKCPKSPLIRFEFVSLLPPRPLSGPTGHRLRLPVHITDIFPNI